MRTSSTVLYKSRSAFDVKLGRIATLANGQEQIAGRIETFGSTTNSRKLFPFFFFTELMRRNIQPSDP